ncbi:MAG TPA: hypothetical protein VGE52_19820 [Pirellulales bacterium]
MTDQPDRLAPLPEDRARRRWRWGLIFSAIVHLGLLGVLVYVPYTWWLSYQKLLTGDFTPAAEEQKEESRKAEEAASSEATPEPPKPKLPPTALSTHAELLPAGPVGDKLKEYVAGIDKLSPEKKQQKLVELSEQLKGVSNPEAVDQMTEKFQEWMKVAPRAEAQEDVKLGGEFDYATAQIDDVVRSRNDKGQWSYRSVLVDAKGRRLETDIDSATGEQIYPTFEQIRSNPLLGQVYRKMVMPLLDKAMQSAQKNSAKEAVESVVPPQ